MDVTTASSVTQQAQNTIGASQKLAEDFDDFLVLLTTQLQNQDPLSPMDSTEFTNQLVAFAGVEQQINGNQKLDNLVNLQLASAAGVALGYVGLDVTYPASEVYFDGENAAKFSYSFLRDTSDASVNIRDSSGSLVFSKDVQKSAGVYNFAWDGTDMYGESVPPGTYTIDISAFDQDGEAMDVSTVATGQVGGVEIQDGVTLLQVGDRAVPLNQVLKARVPEPTPTSSEDASEDTQEQS